MENNILKTSLGSFLQMSLLNISSLIVIIVLARLLSLEEFGVYSLVNAIVFFTTIFFSLGVPASMARFLALSDDKLFRRDIVVKGLSILLPWVFICSGLYFLFYKFFASLFFPEFNSIGLGVIVFSLSIIEILRLSIEKLSHGLSRMSVAAELSAYSSLLLIILLISAAWYFAEAEAVLVAKTIALILPIPLALKKLQRVFQQSIETEAPDPVSKTEIATYGIPLSIVSIAAYCFLQADLLFLGHYWDLSYVGLYSICVFIYVRLTIVPRAIGNGLAPHMARIEHGKEWIEKFEMGICFALTFTLPVSLFCALEGEAFLTVVFGEKYGSAAPVFMMLSLYFLMTSLLAVLNPILDFSGKASIRAVGVVVGAAVNIILNFLWVPQYEMYGAAMATLLGYFVFFFIVSSNLEKNVVVGLIKNKKIIRLLLVGCLMLSMAIAIRYIFLESSHWVTFGVFLIIYPPLLVLFKVYDLRSIEIKIVNLVQHYKNV